MQIISHHSEDLKTAELVSKELLIVNPEDTLQLIVDVYYQGFDQIVIHEKDVAPEFFDLKNTASRRNPAKVYQLPDAAHYSW